MKDIASSAPSIPRSSLEIRDLQVALAIASAGTTARAAALLGLTQPAVSRALLSLEGKLAIPLFDRTPRGLVPTAVGARFLDDAGKLLVSLGELERRARMPEEPLRRIRLVCECYTAYHWVPSVLLHLREPMPELSLSLAVEHTEAPVAGLLSGKVDVALLTTAPVPRGELEERKLFSDEIVFVVAASSPIAKQGRITPDDVRAARLLTSRAPPEEAEWFLSSIFGRARPRLRVDILPLTEAILDLARAGMGIGVLSDWIAEPHLARGDLVKVRLASGPLRRPWRIAWRREVRDVIPRLVAALSTTAPRARSA